MREFARLAGIRGDANYVHVAGTNGKGSVTAMVQSILVEAGFVTGAFFSPYVYDPRERVQLGRELIPEKDFAALVEELIPLSETKFGGATEFEFKTAVGFLYWQRHYAEWVALEVGLGGRLDSTNIIVPRVSVITSISLDHTGILGSTVEEIAAEKAGILKPGVPAVVGDLPPGAMAVVERAADAGIWRYGRDVVLEGRDLRLPTRTVGDLAAPFAGEHMAQNMALAVAALDAAGLRISDEVVRRGLEKTSLPGRFERRVVDGVEVVLDGAHNPASAAALADTLRATFGDGRMVFLCGMVQGHDPGGFFAAIAPLAAEIHLAPIDFHRALAPSELAPFAGRGSVAHGSVADAVGAALCAAKAGGLPLVVTGSFYLLSEVVAAFQSL